MRPFLISGNDAAYHYGTPKIIRANDHVMLHIPACESGEDDGRTRTRRLNVASRCRCRHVADHRLQEYSLERQRKSRRFPVRLTGTVLHVQPEGGLPCSPSRAT
jgi:hypothetical protein